MENNEQMPNENQEVKTTISYEVKNFYKGDFKEIFLNFFRNPIDGIFSIFQKPSEKAYLQSLILYASVFILYFIMSYLLAGDMRKYVDFAVFIKTGLVPVIMMFIITILSFGLKSISGKPEFKNELLTGGLCAIPLGLLMIVLLVIKLFVSDSNVMTFLSDPTHTGVIGGMLLFYIILMLINVFQQSLKASGTKDAMAWYLSPASILLSMYLTFEITKSLF